MKILVASVFIGLAVCPNSVELVAGPSKSQEPFLFFKIGDTIYKVVDASQLVIDGYWYIGIYDYLRRKTPIYGYENGQLTPCIQEVHRYSPAGQEFVKLTYLKAMGVQERESPEDAVERTIREHNSMHNLEHGLHWPTPHIDRNQ